jgi:NTE family protein
MTVDPMAVMPPEVHRITTNSARGALESSRRFEESDRPSGSITGATRRAPHDPGRRRTAFVLGGGGSVGAVQVGMLRALLEAGIRPDLVVGTSIGALNGAFLVGHLDLNGMKVMNQLWNSVHKREVFPISPRNLVRGALGHHNYLFTHLGLRSLITRAELGFSRLEEAPIDLHVVATDLVSGEPIVLSRGDAVEALLASAAIPGVFAPIVIDGRTLIDGGVIANLPVRQAVELGANRLFVLPAMDGGLVTAPHSAVDMMQHSTMIATSALDRAELKEASAFAETHVLPMPDTGGVSIFDFGQTSTLIERAYQLTSHWLQEEIGSPLEHIHLSRAQGERPMLLQTNARGFSVA